MISRRPSGAARFHPIVLAAACFLALLFQAALPARFPFARLFDFPLLVTIYFSMARQDRIFGVALGTAVGILQDALSHGYLGMMGMAKALAGYLAASASTRFDFDGTIARGVLIAIIVVIHNEFLAFLDYGLLNYPFTFRPLRLAEHILVNVALGLILFRLLDRLKRT